MSVPTPVVVNVSENVSRDCIPDTCCGVYEEDDREKPQPGEHGVDNLTFDNREDGR